MNTAAAATQGGSNLALYVAIIGILGTLAAAVITQWMTGRREERRWNREKQLEAQRWERERKERREQWQREDAARLHEDRMKSYASLLAANESLSDLAATVRLIGDSTALDNFGVRLLTAHGGMDSLLEKFESKRRALDEVSDQLQIIGSIATIELSAKIQNAAFSMLRKVWSVDDPRPGTFGDLIEEESHTIWKASRDLLDEVRREMGSGPLKLNDPIEIDDEPPPSS